MITRRTDLPFEPPSVIITPTLTTSTSSIPKGDVVYGAREIAKFLFDDDGNKTRRRVFGLWDHFRHRPETAGFFKLKGALCLSKSRWQAFQDTRTA